MRIEKHEKTPQVITDLRERKKLIWDSLFYSHQRMDLLIITISGAGLYAISEVCKYLLEQKIPVTNFLKIAAALFVLSIIMNFLSQFFSAKTHHKDYCSTILQLEETRTPEQDAELVRYSDESQEHNKTTHKLNVASMWLMFSGLLALTLTLFAIF